MRLTEKSGSILWLRKGGVTQDDQFLEFIRLAESMGHPVEVLREPIGDGAWFDKIRGAAAYILTDPAVIRLPEFAVEVQTQIKTGKRLVSLRPDPGLNPFLNEFDIAVTRKKLMTISPAPATSLDERTIILTEEMQENTLCLALMRGNSDVAMLGPSPVWYGKGATPFFLPSPDARVLSEGDYFETADIRKVACAAAWPVAQADNHRVLVIGGWVVGRPYVDIAGRIHVGLGANRRFGKNLIKWLVGGLHLANDANGDLIQKVHAIEVCLFDIVSGVLKKEFGAEWWAKGVPLEVRKAAAELSEERAGKVPKEGCLHFIDLKNTVDKQWRLHEPVICRKPNSKKEVVDRLVRLSELRNRLSHPMRLRYEPMTCEEAAFIDEEFRFFQQVASVPEMRGTPPRY